jgi:hypothetical protein
MEVKFDEISWRARTELNVQLVMLNSLIVTFLEFSIVKNELEIPAPLNTMKLRNNLPLLPEELLIKILEIVLFQEDTCIIVVT